jgi:hypothetical protein
MFRRFAVLFVALALVGSAVPAAAEVVASGVVVVIPRSVPEGSTFTMQARYDGSGGPPDGMVRIRWADGNEITVDPPTSTPYLVTEDHAFGDDGAETIRVWFRVGSDLYRGAESLVVTNVAPHLAPIPDAFAPVGERWELTVDFTDPGADRFTVTVEWGDGGSSSRDAEPGDRFVHTYDTAGTVTASVSVIDHDGGSDTITFPVEVGMGCFGRRVTVDMAALGITSFTGGDGDDVVAGSDAADVIVTGGGDDAVCAGGGADTVTAGDGNDRVDGGPGDDRIKGQGGADALLGGMGSDVLIGGGGGDVLHGGTGRDTLKGGMGADFLFRSESPSADTMFPGKGADVADVGKRGLDGSIRRYLTAAEALAFQGAARLSDFTTYHPAGQARVTNIQTLADAISGYVVMPGEWFSLNDVVGPRTAAKGYVQAGAIIAGYVQCCDNAANIGGGTSQFATTFYNAIFFSGLEDAPVSLRSRPPNIANSPHTLWFSKYPAGREATMGYPDNDVRFRNDTDAAVLIITDHGPRATADHITVRMYGDTGGRTVEAIHSCRPPGWTIFPEVNAPAQACATYTTSQKVYEANANMSPGTSHTTPSQAGFRITVTRVIHWPDGTITSVPFPWRYDAGFIIIETHPCNIPRGYAGYTGETCPAGGGGGGGGGGLEPM